MIGDPEKISKTRYCHYHKSHGHETVDCFELRDNLEELFREGKLEEFKLSEESEKEKQDRARKGKGVAINMICGGPTAGDSDRARKVKVKQCNFPPLSQVIMSCKEVPRNDHWPMVFTEEYANDLQHPHCDPLLIRGRIWGRVTKKILVDSGSAADVITLNAFEEIGFNKADLKCYRKKLSGFGGGSVRPLGILKAPFTIGEGDTEQTYDIEFVVADYNVTFDVIVGRPSLYTFKASHFIYHNLLLFPTDSE